MTPFGQGLWVPCQHWRSNKRLTIWSPFTPVKISWGSRLSRKIWSSRNMGPWAEQLVIVRAKLRFCPQSDRNKNDTYFPFSIDMEKIKWRGNLLEWKGEKTNKQTKTEWVFFFFLSWKQRRYRAEWAGLGISSFLLLVSLLFWLLPTLRVCTSACFLPPNSAGAAPHTYSP